MNEVYSYLMQAAEKWPKKIAVHDQHGSLTFQQLYRNSEALCHKLTEAGVENGHGFGVMARNGQDFLTALFAGVAAGATVMPISHQIKGHELELMLREAPLHFILDDFGGINPLRDNIQTEVSVGRSQFRLSYTSENLNTKMVPHVSNAAFVRFTSGTTGTAKGVVLSQRAVSERTEAAQKALNLSSEDTVTWVLPMAFHFIVSCVAYVRYGVTIAVCKDLLARSIIEASNKFQATLLYAAPMHIRMLAQDKSGLQLDSLKKVVSTSAGISQQIAANFFDRFQKPLSQAYGIIELGLPIINNDGVEEFPDSVGHAAPGYQVKLFDIQDGVGELAMRGPGMFDAYLKPALPAEKFLREGWFLTGDLATLDATGRVTICGRKKSMINVSGNKVFPEEVESVLCAHSAVKDARVFGMLHSLFGEIVQAEVVLKPGEEVRESDLIKLCRNQLSTYKVPQKISFIEEVAKTPTGKTIRSKDLHRAQI